jgi:nicotinate phosphoribosyltransferase
MSYRFDPGEVVVQQDGGNLTVFIKGRWFRTIFWEVRLMAIISELYFRMTGKTPDVETNNRIITKAKKMSEAGCLWADFGTRRRFDFKVQDAVCHLMKGTKGFLGTSNVYLAMKHDIKPIGTSAHEMVMGLSAKYGVTMANKMWLVHWANYFQGLNGIALTDTFTTDVFLRDFDSLYARLFDGVRQDSGDPSEWGRKMLDHYKKLGIDTHTKKFVFSDGLDPDTFGLLILGKARLKW